jgi:hypothetical protein
MRCAEIPDIDRCHSPNMETDWFFGWNRTVGGHGLLVKGAEVLSRKCRLSMSQERHRTSTES